jgi:hypothetical protein
MEKTYSFDPKKAWLVHIELEDHLGNVDITYDDEGKAKYTIYIDGEAKQSTHRKIEFAADEDTQLKDIEARLVGTKGIKQLSIRKWKIGI